MDNEGAFSRIVNLGISLASGEAMMRSSETSPLMLLPTELRVMILTLLVVFNDSIMLPPQSDMPAVCTLLATNKKIRSEVLELFFGKNSFFVNDPLAGNRFIRKLPARFISRIQSIGMDLLVSGYEFDTEFAPLMLVIRLMKTLKNCTITLRGCKCGYRLSNFVESQILPVSARCGTCERIGYLLSLRGFCGKLQMSKTCHLTVRITENGDEIQAISVQAMEAIRKGHHWNGMDWSGFLALKKRKADDL